MNNIIDTKGKITFGEDFPKLAIGDKLYEVNDLKETADKISEIFKDATIEDKDRAILNIALGEAAVKELEGMKLKAVGFANLVKFVMATIQGVTFEEFEKMANEKN